MPQHWAIWFTIDGDLRFLSHHDTMRCMERTALRAHLPLRFSQGFNPRPAVALACPRPVGVASRADLAVMAMADDAPQLQETVILGSLNSAAPRGMRFTQARPIERRTVHPRRIECELPLEENQGASVGGRIGELDGKDAWVVTRHSGQDKRDQEIDLRPMVKDLRIEGQSLRWTLLPRDQAWARPGEVLSLVGLDPQADLARVVRAAVEYE